MGRQRLQYTIEARELTSESTHRPSTDAEPRRRTIEADDDAEALRRFVREEQSELMSLARPANGNGESIATVKKEDAVFLVRVYAT